MRIELTTGIYEIIDWDDDWTMDGIEGNRLYFQDKSLMSFMPLYIELPEGKWQWIGTTTEIAGDSQKSMDIIDAHWDLEGRRLYMDYRDGFIHSGKAVGSTFSFRSLCDKHQIKNDSAWLKLITQ